MKTDLDVTRLSQHLTSSNAEIVIGTGTWV